MDQAIRSDLKTLNLLVGVTLDVSWKLVMRVDSLMFGMSLVFHLSSGLLNLVLGMSLDMSLDMTSKLQMNLNHLLFDLDLVHLSPELLNLLPAVTLHVLDTRIEVSAPLTKPTVDSLLGLCALLCHTAHPSRILHEMVGNGMAKRRPTMPLTTRLPRGIWTRSGKKPRVILTPNGAS